MRWTILLRREDNTNISQSSDLPLLSIERDDLPDFAQLGLMHREGKCILRNLQSAMLNQQAQEYFARRRPCTKCNKLRNIKDYRERRLQSLYGVVRLRLPRFNRCDCEPKAAPCSWFGSELIPGRTTPEWMAMQAALGARMPYREAAFLLSAFLPADRLRNHGSIRNQTIRVGSRIALEETVAPPNSCPGSVASGSVAIDGTYVRGHGRDGPSKLHVVVGAVKLERRTKSAFAFVQQHKPHQRQLRSMWQKIGCHSSTPLRVVTDGDTGLHNLVKQSFPGTTTHILDWFHLAMRLNAIERSIGYGLMRAKQSPARIRQVERELESIHHHLWHGDSDIVNWQIGTLVNELESTIAPTYLDYFSPLRSTLDKMIDLRKYLTRFQDETISYSIEHREKQPVSTSPVESLINRLVNHRMNKRQQMRWSIHGAQSLLQLRVALLNRTLGPIFGHWYPGFSVSHMIEPIKLKAA